MKFKKLYFTLAVLLCGIFVCITFLGCDIQKPTLIYFYVDGEFYYSVDNEGDYIEMPDNPKKDDYTFVGWFADDGVWNTPFSYDNVLDKHNKKDLNFYAKWKLLIDDKTIGDIDVDRLVYTDSRGYNDVLEVSDGYVAVGELYYAPLDAVIAKYDKQGNPVWQKAFGGSDLDAFYSIIEVSDGYIVDAVCASNDGHLSGLKKDSRGQGSYVTVKYDTSGNLVWSKELGVNACVSNNDGFLAVGGIKSLSEDSLFVAQFSADGNLVWKKSIAENVELYEGYNPYWWQSISISEVFIAPDGYLLFGRSRYSYSCAISDGPMFMLSLDKNGNVRWQRDFEINLIEAIDVSNNGIFVAGTTQKYEGEIIIGGFPIGTIIYDCIQKYDFEMNLTWETSYDREGYIVFNDAKTIDGNIFIAGFNATYTDGGFIIGIDSNGEIFWEEIGGASYNNIFPVNGAIGVYRGAIACGVYSFEIFDLIPLTSGEE